MLRYHLRQKYTIVSNVFVSPPAEHLRVYSNGVHIDYTMKVTLNILSISIYFNNNSMSDIISLKEVENSFRVTMDTK